MKSHPVGSWSGLIPALWLCLALPANGASEPVVAFGLTNTSIGSAVLESRGNDLVVRDLSSGGAAGIPGFTRFPVGLEGAYGVSIQLGQADAGVFVYPNTYSDPYSGSFLVGKAIGQLDGQENQLLSVVAASKEDYGSYVAHVDFSGIGAFLLRYELYVGDQLVVASTNAASDISILTEYEYAPRANPFWRLPDGGIAAVIEFTGAWVVRLPGTSEKASYTSGDRIVVRPLDAQGEVGRVSRVEVTGGGAMTEFAVTDERLGAFQHAHKALGQSLFHATADSLTLTSLGQATGGELGVLVELEEPRSFAVDLAPLNLSSNGAAIVAGAVGSFEHGGSEFLGYIGVRQSNGAREVFGDLSLFQGGLSLSVYRDGCQSGATGSPTLSPTVGVGGAARVVGFGATADTGNRQPSFSVRFEDVATFTMPDGSVLTGDELRFRSTGPLAADHLVAFSLLGTNLPAITILGESGADVITLGDYLPELASAASIKLIAGTVNGSAQSFRQSAAPTQRGGVPLVLLGDTLPPAVSRTSLFAWRDDALWFHGGDSAALGLFSGTGVRLLPVQPARGQSYAGAGSFLWHDPVSGNDTPVQVTATSRAAGFENVSTPAGSFYALRLETSLVFGTSAETNAPRAWHTTNWLSIGVGIVALAESEQLADGSIQHRAGAVSAYNVLTSVPLAPVVNVGANALLTVAAVSETGDPAQFQWHKDGVALTEEGASSQLLVGNARLSDAGLYSVVSSNLAGEVSALIATLRVTPFEESSGFLAWQGSGSGYIEEPFVAGDQAGNIYYAGALRGYLEFETNFISDTGLQRLLFVAKFDSAGHFVWIRTADGPFNETLMNLGVDAAGDAYLFGNYRESITFGALTLSAAGPDENAFAAKLSADGNWLWAVQPEAAAGAYGFRSAVDAAGNQLISGTFRGPIQIGTNHLQSLPGQTSFYFAKLDHDGHVAWAAKSSMPGDYVYLGIQDVKADGAGGFYLSGIFTDHISLGGLQLSAGSNQWSGFLARLDGDGGGVWAKTLASGVDLGVADDGGLYVLGAFNGVLDLGGAVLTGSNFRWTPDRYVARLRPDGTAVWGRKLPLIFYYSYSGLAVDSAGSVYMASPGSGNIMVGETTFSSWNDYSSLMIKYNAEGQRVWSKQITGQGGPVVYSFGRDGLGNVIFSGGFNYSVNLGPTNFSGSGGFNPFFVSMRPAVPPAVIQQPQSSTVNPGASVNFTAVATGTAPLEYQWRRDGVDIAGATSAALTLASVQAGDAGVYSLRVRNGGGLAFSQPAVLQVNLPDAGTLAFSAANFTVSEAAGHADITLVRTGDTSRPATVTVETADGSAKAGPDYTPLTAVLAFGPGESVKTIEIPISQDALYEPTETLLLRLCNPGGGATLGAPATATLAILDDDSAVPVILSQPHSRVAGDGSTVSFSVTANGAAPLQYEWRKGGTPLAGANGSTFTLGPVHMADAGVYSVRVFNGAGEAISSDVTLTVLPLPQILAHPQSQTVPYGEPVAFSVSATSSVPVLSQSFARMGTGPAIDTFQVPNSIRRGVIEIRADFGSEADSLNVYVGRILVYATGLTSDRTTNRVGFDYSYPPPIQIVINREEGAGNDAWSYEGEIVSEPLRYRWRKDAQEIPFVFGPQYAISSATMVHTGAYDVVVSDALGTVTSQPATLTLTPPVLSIRQLTINPPQVQLLWISPDHMAERTLELPNGTWEWISYPYSGVILDATNHQEYFRLRYMQRSVD
jgi:hypothetical protein